MFITNKYRIYPSDEQCGLMDKHFGCVRFIYNLALETKSWAYSAYKVNVSRYDLQAQLKDLKRDYVWLKDVNSQSLQSALLNLDFAYTNFFKGRAGFPNFKKRSDRQSFACPQNVTIGSGVIRIPKFKKGIKIVLHRPILGEIKSATISKTPTGKYFVSVLSETKKSVNVKGVVSGGGAIGVDLGVKSFAVLSDGSNIDNPKYLRKSLKRLKVLGKRVSKKVKGSNNRKKAVRRLAVLHEKISNQRKDFIHKVTDAITKQYDTICIEDLAVSSMIRNRKLSLSISDVSWGMFVLSLKYKSEWRGKNVLKIGRFEPSSKLHNSCGYVNGDLRLSDREWVCPNCGEVVLRDVNAAINVKNFALLKNSGVERTREPAELPTLVGALKQEKFIKQRFIKQPKAVVHNK